MDRYTQKVSAASRSAVSDQRYIPTSLLSYVDKNRITQSPMNVLITNRDKDQKEIGHLFVPTQSDSKRIYDFLQKSLPEDKALEYTQNEIDYLIGLKSSVLSCVTNPDGLIVGITIAFPSKYLPKAAENEKWTQEGGFSDKFFNDNAIYSELRALASAYRGNGLGDILRSKQIFDVVNRGYDKIVLYSVPGAYKNNSAYGFKDNGLVKLLFDGGKTSDTHLMTLDITDSILDKSKNVLDTYRR